MFGFTKSNIYLSLSLSLSVSLSINILSFISIPSCIIARYDYVWNGHIMFIYIYNIEHRNLETRKTRNDFSVQVRNFLLPLSSKVRRHKEREAQSFSSGFFICTPSRVTPVQGLREQAKVNPSRPVSSLNSTDFFKISQNPPRASGACRHSHSVTPFPLSGFCDISEWHVHYARACAWTPV